MAGIAEQLGLDQTFYIQFALVAVLFFLLSQVFFKPFMKLIHLRHKKVVEDRVAAEKLMSQADARFEEYKRRLAEERALARKEYEAMLTQAKTEEAQILNTARGEAKQITQAAVDSVNQQRDQLKKQLDGEVEGLAKSFSDALLTRRES